LPRASWYRRQEAAAPQPETALNLALMDAIDRLYTVHPDYGSRRMAWCLQQQGQPVNRKRVQRLMQKMGLRSVLPQPNTSKKQPGHKVYPYLLRHLMIDRPDQVWCTDITYLRLRQGFVYLSAIMDWASRYVIAWRLSNTPDTEFCLATLRQALRLGAQPEIFNSDQGCQYTSEGHVRLLQGRGIRISMDGKGRALDNIMVERLWRTVKYEEIYLREYEDLADLNRHLRRYFDYYNNERPHQSLDYQTPAQVYRPHKAGLVKAA
jgi:putative transposase